MATLTPNTDAEVSIREQGVLSIDKQTITPTTTPSVYEYTVPTGKIVKPRCLTWVCGSGTITSIIFEIHDPGTNRSVSVLKTTETNSNTWNFNDIEVPAGWIIKGTMNYTAGTPNFIVSGLFRTKDE